MDFGICILEFLYYICNPINNWRRGRAARLGSAKAPTPVRIRTMPLLKILSIERIFYFKFLRKLINVLLEPEEYTQCCHSVGIT